MMRTFFGSNRSFQRWALALGLSSSLVASGGANAQTATEPEETQERVIVTGSNIPTAAEVGSAPVTILDQQAIQRTGTDDPQVALQMSDPSFTGGGNLGTSNADISATTTNGGSEVSLRGLPTLVLLDGRRIADSAAAITLLPCAKAITWTLSRIAKVTTPRNSKATCRRFAITMIST
jgi:outer membrane receptor for ferrienterochelin and colicin